MNKTSFFLSLLFCLLGLSLQAQKKGKTPGIIFPVDRLDSLPLRMDGQLDDWPLPLFQPANTVGIQAKALWDAEYFYIALRIPETGTQRLVMQYGMTVRLDTLGSKKSKHLGLAYPLPLRDEEWAALGEKAALANKQGALEALYAQACQEFDLLNALAGDEERLRVSNLGSKSYKAYIGFDELQALQIELRLPLNAVFLGEPALGREFRLSIAVNDPPKSQDDDQQVNFHSTNSAFGNPMSQGANPMMGGQGMMGGPGMGGMNPAGANPLNPGGGARPPMRGRPSMPAVRMHCKLSRP